MIDQINILEDEMIGLLKNLIVIPSFSREENGTAELIAVLLTGKDISVRRIGNNIVSLNKSFDSSKPTILLNSHHDTVKPNPGYTRDPFSPVEEEGKLYGLGSNDAGGALVSLLSAFLHFYSRPGMNYNLVFAATAEEEISGPGGIESILSELPKIDCAIVGEPTLMNLAVAERGLMVLDCRSSGIAGHAARDEGDNAIYHAIDDIAWFRQYRFPKVSELLGPNKMTVSVINTQNKAHNVVPANCDFVVDTRINELYSFDEVLSIIRDHVKCEVKPRSTRLRSTTISLDHPLVKAGVSLGRNCYGSPTTSDKALMPFPTLKMGPGDSARSHTADEFIYLHEINEGIKLYIQLLNKLV